METITDLLMIQSTFDVVAHVGVATAMAVGNLCLLIEATR